MKWLFQSSTVSRCGSLEGFGLVFFLFLSGTLFFIPVTLNPRLIHEVNEVLRPTDKLQWLIPPLWQMAEAVSALTSARNFLVATFFSDKHGRKYRNHFIFLSTFSLWKDKSDAGVPLHGCFLPYRSTGACPQVVPKSLIRSSALSPRPACLRGERAAYPLFFVSMCTLFGFHFFFPWGKQNHRQGCSLRRIPALLCRQTAIEAGTEGLEDLPLGFDRSSGAVSVMVGLPRFLAVVM